MVRVRARAERRARTGVWSAQDDEENSYAHGWALLLSSGMRASPSVPSDDRFRRSGRADPAIALATVRSSEATCCHSRASGVSLTKAGGEHELL